MSLNMFAKWQNKKLFILFASPPSTTHTWASLIHFFLFLTPYFFPNEHFTWVSRSHFSLLFSDISSSLRSFIPSILFSFFYSRFLLFHSLIFLLFSSSTVSISSIVISFFLFAHSCHSVSNHSIFVFFSSLFTKTLTISFYISFLLSFIPTFAVSFFFLFSVLFYPLLLPFSLNRSYAQLINSLNFSILHPLVSFPPFFFTFTSSSFSPFLRDTFNLSLLSFQSSIYIFRK